MSLLIVHIVILKQCCRQSSLWSVILCCAGRESYVKPTPALWLGAKYRYMFSVLLMVTCRWCLTMFRSECPDTQEETLAGHTHCPPAVIAMSKIWLKMTAQQLQ
jgi:hypothetical protein